MIAIGLAVFLPMLLEAAIADRHERQQRTRGGVEPEGDVYRLMRVAYPGLFLLMLGERLLRGAPGSTVVGAGVGLYAAAKLLKWWAIKSLGRFWTFRVIVVPGERLVATGPYRYLRHPNYLAVLGEFVGVALMANARVSGPAATALFGALMLKRIAVENRALRDLGQ